ncbi:hypothetical protein LJR118_003622 [Acidovorax sp. LjRoot118]|uniref:hypothetical protein n=1 Tax=Acidovorax sp. LjRoot118 TaxID=3342256 RepID=UPI003ECDB3E4
MRLPDSPPKPSNIASMCIAISGIAAAFAANAEAPMTTDDAGTLSKGAMKLESVISRDDKTTGVELIFGAGVAKDLEMEVALSRSRDSHTSPSTRFHGRALGVKWVPVQNEMGWSLGARLDMGGTRLREDVTPEHSTESEFAVTGLASYRMVNLHVLHLNAGGRRIKAQGSHSTAATWAAGYEIPLTQKAQLTMEVHGAHNSRPDKAIGVRYEITAGVKASAAFGHGDGRTFSQLGVAWEF